MNPEADRPSDDELNRRITARAEVTSLGAVALAKGITVVALDEEGRLTEYSTGGTTRLL